LETAGDLLPTNGQGKLRRVLDCAVIETLHEIRKQLGEPAYDSVRASISEKPQNALPAARFGPPARQTSLSPPKDGGSMAPAIFTSDRPTHPAPEDPTDGFTRDSTARTPLEPGP
jgi:hypothetical protein